MEFSSLSECEKSKKISSTPSELDIFCFSTLSELVILNHIISSSLGVLIEKDIKNRKEGNKRELIL